QVIRASLSALGRLTRDESPIHLVPILRLLRRLAQESKEKALRTEALALLNRQAGQSFAIEERATDAATLQRAYQPVFAWFEKQHASLARALYDTSDEAPAFWDKVLKSVDWSKGDAIRGETLFQQRACQTCHSGTRALGPDLTGVANRLSREDLFTAIIDPSR